MVDCTLSCPESLWSHFTYQGSRTALRNSILIYYLYTEHALLLLQDLSRSTVCCGTTSLLGGHNSLIDRAVVLAAPGAVGTSNTRKREAFVPSSMQKLPLSGKKQFNGLPSLHRSHGLSVVWTYKIPSLEVQRCAGGALGTGFKLCIVTGGWKKRMRLWRGREVRGGNQ